MEDEEILWVKYEFTTPHGIEITYWHKNDLVDNIQVFVGETEL